MANDPKTSGSDDGGAFLGGKKFNQAGNNIPLPGEKVSQATNDPGPFGGPRVWIGTAVVLILLVSLWFVYGGGVFDLHQGVHRGSVNDKPSVDPDADTNSPSQAGQ